MKFIKVKSSNGEQIINTAEIIRIDITKTSFLIGFSNSQYNLSIPKLENEFIINSLFK